MSAQTAHEDHSVPVRRAPVDAAVTTHVPGGPVGAIALLVIVIGIVMTAFALPAVNSSPRDVPIGVAGPAQAVQQITAGLTAKAPGSFAVTTYSGASQLSQAIRDRDVYGGIAVGPQGPSVLTAPPGSPAVAQGLAALAAGLGQQLQRPVPVTEVVSLPVKDARGVGLGAALLPLLIGGIAPVLAMMRLVQGGWRQLAGVLSAAVVLGAALAGLLHWFGIFEGGWLLQSGAMAVVVAAMATPLLGLFRVAGGAGLGVGFAAFMLLGNPLSGLQTAPEFLAEPWRTIGAWLPPGAGGQLLRSSAYFDGAGSAPHLLVLGCWLAFGILLVALGARRGAVRLSTA